MQTTRHSGGTVSTILSYPIYHVLLAVYFPLWLISNNRGLFDTADVFRPVLISIGLALVAFAALAFLYRDWHKAAFLTTVGIACFYSFSLLRDLLPIYSAGSGALVVLATVWLGAALLAFKTQKPWPSASKILNGFMAAMLLIPAAKIADLQFGDVVGSKAAAIEYRRPAAESARPNIIHIVLDGYSRADVLKELYGWDNSDFIRSLRDLGFVVPAHITTAYSQTLLSMNSIFSLNYINDRVSALAENNTDEELRLALNQDLQNSRLLQSLKSLKYTLIDVESLYQGVHLENADHLIWARDESLGLSYFEKTLIDFTPIGRIIERLAVNDAMYTRVRFSLADHDYSKFKRPFFVYNHILAPHPPFNIAADGQVRPDSFRMGDGSHRLEIKPRWYEDYRKGYLAKLSYTNKAILAKVRHLIANVPDPKIIVVHSDHGGGLMLDKDNKARTCLKERMSAFLAVYSSGDFLASEIPDRMNLVNLYRVLLRNGFGADLPLLPSHSYFAAWEEPQRFEPVSTAELETFGPTCTRPREAIAARH